MFDFTFKGRNSREFGITVARRPARETANERATITEVDGLNGGLLTTEGLNTYVMEFDIIIEGQSNLVDISGWLQGEGEFTRSDYPGKGIQVYKESGITYLYLADDLYTATLTLYVNDPTWYLLEDKWYSAWGENLITDGWDSFKPYGIGKNYAINWDFGTSDIGQYQGGNAATIRIEEGELKLKVDNPNRPLESSSLIIAIPNSRDVPLGKYIMRVKIKSNVGNTRMYYRPDTGEGVPDRKQQDYYFPEGEWEVIEMEINRTLMEPFKLYIYARASQTEIQLGDAFEIDWIQFTPQDNQHLVVEKTPISEELTRIQTWGGNSRLKIRALMTTVGKHNFKQHIDNKNFLDIYFADDSKETISRGSDVVVVKEINNVRTPNIVRYFSEGINYNLDFKASLPMITEAGEIPTWTGPDPSPRIINEGTGNSKPIIRITKNKESILDIIVDGVRFIYEFKGNDSYVEIDCETHSVRDEKGTRKNRQLQIGYNFPELKPGDNIVKIISGDATVEFRRKDRWR